MGSDLDLDDVLAGHPKALADLRERLIIAFVQGAKWQMFKTHGYTAWASERDAMEAAAIRRADEGRLGVDPYSHEPEA